MKASVQLLHGLQQHGRMARACVSYVALQQRPEPYGRAVADQQCRAVRRPAPNPTQETGERPRQSGGNEAAPSGRQGRRDESNGAKTTGTAQGITNGARNRERNKSHGGPKAHRRVGLGWVGGWGLGARARSPVARGGGGVVRAVDQVRARRGLAAGRLPPAPRVRPMLSQTIGKGPCLIDSPPRGRGRVPRAGAKGGCQGGSLFQRTKVQKLWQSPGSLRGRCRRPTAAASARGPWCCRRPPTRPPAGRA